MKYCPRGLCSSPQRINIGFVGQQLNSCVDFSFRIDMLFEKFNKRKSYFCSLNSLCYNQKKEEATKLKGMEKHFDCARFSSCDLLC